MRSGAILSGVFAARIEAVKALLAATDGVFDNSGQLRQLATALDDATTRYGDVSVALAYSAFASLIRTLAMLVEWRAAVRGATVDADRFLRSAHVLHRAWLEEYGESEVARALVAAAAPIAELAEVERVAPICRTIASVPLPIGIYAADTRFRIPRFDAERQEQEPPPELTVAFIRFNIDGKPAADTDFLTPKEVHDLEIEVRISRWPDAAEALTLAPMTIEARSSYDFHTFRFPRPTGDPPYHLRERGRAVLQVAQGLRAQPFEFRYAADFEPRDVEQPVAVVGHRNLRLNGIDRPITGYEGVDRRLLEIRDVLRQRPLVTAADVTNVLTLVAALGSLAGQAVQDNLFSQPLNERAFQNHVRGYLRQRPEIGPRLEEHPRAAGGETDLSLERIRLELKSEKGRPLRFADCQQFVGQTSTYAAGSDKRVAVLCVLDGSRKFEQPFPADEGIGILRTDDDAVAVVTILIQGNFVRPSDLSRPKRRSRLRREEGRNSKGCPIS